MLDCMPRRSQGRPVLSILARSKPLRSVFRLILLYIFKLLRLSSRKIYISDPWFSDRYSGMISVFYNTTIRMNECVPHESVDTLATLVSTLLSSKPSIFRISPNDVVPHFPTVTSCIQLAKSMIYFRHPSSGRHFESHDTAGVYKPCMSF